MANSFSWSLIFPFSCSTHNCVRSTWQCCTTLSGPSTVKQRCGVLRMDCVRVIWDWLSPLCKGVSSHMELSPRRILPFSPSLHFSSPTMRQDSVSHSSGPSIVTINFSVSFVFPRTRHLAAGTATRHVTSCWPSSSYGTLIRNWISCTPELWGVYRTILSWSLSAPCVRCARTSMPSDRVADTIWNVSPCAACSAEVRLNGIAISWFSL